MEIKYKKIKIIILMLEIILVIFALSRLRDSGQIYTLNMQGISEEEATQILAADGTDTSSGAYQIPAYRSDAITLPAGVYRVVLEYTASADLDNIVEVKAEDAPYSALKTNATALYAGQSSTDYDFWLFEKNNSISVYVTQGSDNTLDVTGCYFVRTNYMERTFFFLSFLLFVLTCLVMWKEKVWGKYWQVKENRIVTLGLFFIIILSSWAMCTDVLLPGADETFHLLRIEGIKEGLLSGQFPVRLQPNWLQGYGYAVSFFYCDLFLYFPAVLRILGFTVQAAYKWYKVAVDIATVLVAYYSFRKMFQNKIIGLLGSFLYSFSLLRLVYFYAIDGVGQYTGIIFMPLVCYGFWLIFTSDTSQKEYRTSWLPLTIGMSGMIECHVLTCTLTVMFAVLLCVICIRKVFRKKVFLSLCKAVLVSVFLNLWYLLPMLDYMHSMEFSVTAGGATQKKIQEYGMYLSQLFDFFPKGGQYGSYPADQGPVGETAYSIGLALTFAGVLCIYLLWLHGKEREKMPEKQRNVGPIALFLGILSLYMATIYFPWDSLERLGSIARSVIATIQFPNRFLAVSDVLFTVVACWVVSFLYYSMDLNKKRERSGVLSFFYGRAALMAAVFMIVGTALTATYYLDTTLTGTSFFRIYDATCMGNGYISGGEYVLLGTDVSTLTYKDAVSSEGVNISSYEKQYSNVNLACTNEINQAGYIELPLLYYKGYQALDVQTGEKLSVICGDNNVVRVIIPANYQGSIQIQFCDLWYYRLAEVISVITLIWLFLLARKKNRGILTNANKLLEEKKHLCSKQETEGNKSEGDIE